MATLFSGAYFESMGYKLSELINKGTKENTLSLKEIGLLTLFHTYFPFNKINFDLISISDIQRITKDGRKSVSNALEGLESKGYLLRLKTIKRKGKKEVLGQEAWIYTFERHNFSNLEFIYQTYKRKGELLVIPRSVVRSDLWGICSK